MSWTEQTGTNLGNIGLEKVQTTLQSIVVKSSFKGHELISFRCRTRNCRRGFYFDPVTFDVTDVTDTSTGAVFAAAESPQVGDTEGVDEVSYDCCLRNMADSMVFQIHRLLEFVLESSHKTTNSHLTHLQSWTIRDPFSGKLCNLTVSRPDRPLTTRMDQNIISEILEGHDYPRVFQVS